MKFLSCNHGLFELYAATLRALTLLLTEFDELLTEDWPHHDLQRFNIKICGASDTFKS